MPRSPRALSVFAAAAAAAGAGLALIAAPGARAAGDAVGELGQGGTAKGDISTQAGESDRIGLDLTQGEPVDIRFRAGFAASFSLIDPDGGAVATGFTNGQRKLTQKGWTAPSTGRFEFRVASFDGSQGLYKLQAKAAWPKTVKVGPAPQQTVTLGMPANSAITASLKGRTVTVNAFTAPDASVLISALTGTAKALKVPRTDCGPAGMYSFDVSAASGNVSGTITRVLPKTAAQNPNISNGLDQVSFGKSGLGDYFRARCGNCHFWGGGYGGVRAYARDSLARMRSGNMPEGGPRASSDTIALLDQWIKSGYGR